MPSAMGDGVVDQARNRLLEMMAAFSIEVTPRELATLLSLDRLLAAGTPVFITWLANTGFGGTVTAARRIAAEGMRPVPHLAVRALRSEHEADDVVGRLATEADVRWVLVIAGSLERPAGPYAATMDLLASGVLQRHGINRVGVAGHPEGSPDVPGPDLTRALAEKNCFAVATGLDVHILTQFCFSGEPVVAWERSIREQGNALPVHVGLPGIASVATLVKFGLRCGVGPSLAVMKKQAGNVFKLASARPQYPDRTMARVVRSAADDGSSLYRSFHFFPFGGFERTAAWALKLRNGRFTLPPDDGILALD